LPFNAYGPLAAGKAIEPLRSRSEPVLSPPLGPGGQHRSTTSSAVWYVLPAQPAAQNQSCVAFALEWQRRHSSGLCVAAPIRATHGNRPLSAPFRLRYVRAGLFSPERGRPATAGRCWRWAGTGAERAIPGLERGRDSLVEQGQASRLGLGSYAFTGRLGAAIRAELICRAGCFGGLPGTPGERRHLDGPPASSSSGRRTSDLPGLRPGSHRPHRDSVLEVVCPWSGCSFRKFR